MHNILTQDPFQNYQTLGAYPGGATQYGVPLTAFQPSTNPLAFTAQQFANPLAGGFAGQQLPLQQPLLQNPLLAGLQHSLGQGQNPLIAAIQQNALQAAIQQGVLQAAMQNPLLTASLQNPLLQQQLLQQQLLQGHSQNPMLAGLQNPQINPMQSLHSLQQGWPQPYGWQQGWQQQPQFNYPLAPQSLIGVGGIGQPFAGLRPVTGFGASPFAGCFQ